jgi:poly-gamma-glutamate capsule biosynthesis protein CapA/YwtB (metallophosphatase superfamily)
MRRNAAKTCFLLLEPRGLCNSGEVAKRMAKCRGVKEVHLTSGRFGCVVSANANSRNEVERISSALRKVAKSKSVSVAMSHFVYR